MIKKFKEQVYGILAAPPCCEFASSGARWWKSKGDKALLKGLSVVDACLRIIYVSRPVFWALENPVGRLKDYIGEPIFYFDPCDYGDNYTKKAALWGRFNLPEKNPVEPISDIPPGNHSQDIWLKSKMKNFNKKNRKALRSMTPAGFAKAFFEANK